MDSENKMTPADRYQTEERELQSTYREFLDEIRELEKELERIFHFFNELWNEKNDREAHGLDCTDLKKKIDCVKEEYLSKREQVDSLERQRNQSRQRFQDLQKYKHRS